MTRWFFSIWAILLLVSAWFFHCRRSEAELPKSLLSPPPRASHCEWLALRALPAAYRVAEQDMASPTGPAAKFAGKYTVRALAKGEPVCEQDLSLEPRLTIPQGSVGIVMPVSPGPWNAGVLVDLWRSGATALEKARVLVVLCSPSCTQAVIEVPAEKVTALLGAQGKDKEIPVVVIREFP